MQPGARREVISLAMFRSALGLGLAAAVSSCDAGTAGRAETPPEAVSPGPPAVAALPSESGRGPTAEPVRRKDDPNRAVVELISGDRVQLPPFLKGSDALAISVARLRERLGLAADKSSGHGPRIQLGGGPPVSMVYALFQAVRAGRTRAEIDALPVDAVEFTVRLSGPLQAFVDRVTKRWGAPELGASPDREESQAYYWRDDDAGLAMRAEATRASLAITFHRYLPTRELPGVFSERLTEHLGEHLGEVAPGSPFIELRNHPWGDPLRPLHVEWHASARDGGPHTIHSLRLPVSYRSRPAEMGALDRAMIATWGDPQRGCSPRAPRDSAYLFSTPNPIVAVREANKWVLFGFDSAVAATHEFRPAAMCPKPAGP